MKAFSSISFEALDDRVIPEALLSVKQMKIPIRDANQADEMTLRIYLHNGYWLVGDKRYTGYHQLLQDYLYVPQVFQRTPTPNEYRRELAERLNNLSVFRRNAINILNENLICTLGAELDRVYEKYTGAIQFEDYEWERISPADPLKRFFSSKKDGVYLYLMNTESAVLLRGVAVYYFHAAYGKVNQFGGKDRLDYWFSNVSSMLDSIKDALRLYSNHSSSSRRLLLGIVDNLRNIVLIFLNHELLCSCAEKSCLWDSSGQSTNARQHKLTEMIFQYQNIILSLTQDNSVNIPYVCDILRGVAVSLSMMSREIQEEVKTDSLEWSLYKRFAPLPRENDHYFENYITLRFCIEKLPAVKQQKPINIVGILSGGLELPFICKQLYSNVNIFLVYQNLGTYFERQARNVSDILQNIDVSPKAKCHCKYDTIVLDDNIMCGTTAQHIINELVYGGFLIRALWCIKHPDIGRAPQVLYYGHCVNFKAVDSGFIDGMLFPASYTKIPEGENLAGYFLNEFGVYSQAVDVFLRGLYKNGGFVAGSEVDIFKGFNHPKTQDLVV